MIRLAIRGIEEVACRQLSTRLRQTSIVELLPDCRSDPPKDCDAIAFPGSESIEDHVIAQCLSKRIHVLLAASQRFSGDDLSEWCATAAISNAHFCVVNPDRYLPSRQLIRDQLNAGQLGDVGLIRSHRWESRETVVDSRTGLPDSLIRDLELTTWLSRQSPEVVYAVEHGSAQPSTRRPAQIPEHLHPRQSVQVHLGFRGGAMAFADYSNKLPLGSGYQMLSVIGSSGVAYADDHRNLQLHFSGGTPRGLHCSERTQGLTNMMQAFVDHLISGNDMSSSAEDWQKALQLAETVRWSLETRSSVRMKEH